MNPALTPRLFDPSWTFDPDFCDLEWMGGQYGIADFPGTTFHFGARTGGEQVVHVETGLTLPEVKARMAANPMMRLLGPQEDQSAEELQNFTRVLQALQWPLRPKMPFADVATFCSSRFPRLFCTRMEPVEEAAIQQPMTRRSLAALDGSTLVIMSFRDELLWSLELFEPALFIANDNHVEGLGKALREIRRRELIAEAATDPGKAVQDLLCQRFTPEEIEHSRGLTVISLQPESPNISEEANALPDMPEMLVPPEHANTHMHDFEGDDMTLAMHRAQQVRRHRLLLQRHGSLEAVIRETADKDLFDQLSFWFGRNQTSMHPQPPDLRRMIEVLSTLHQQVMNDGGLENWLVNYLPEAWDAMPSLLAIGAHDFVMHLARLAEQAQAEGCVVTNGRSWEKWFEKDPRMAAEEAAVPFARAIPAQFRAWSLANMPSIQAESDRFQAELARMVPRSSQDMMNALLGQLAGQATRAIGGMVKNVISDAASGALGGIASMFGFGKKEPASEPNGLDVMEQFGHQFALEEERRLREQYATLDELIGSAPLKKLLAHASAYGGYRNDQTIDHLDPAPRMAACFLEFSQQVETMGLDMWFDMCWPTLGRPTLTVLRDAGASAIADRLQSLSLLPAQKGEQIDDIFSWTDFASDHDDEWPSEDETTAWLEALPQAFRQHWSRQTALA